MYIFLLEFHLNLLDRNIDFWDQGWTALPCVERLQCLEETFLLSAGTCWMMEQVICSNSRAWQQISIWSHAWSIGIWADRHFFLHLFHFFGWALTPMVVNYGSCEGLNVSISPLKGWMYSNSASTTEHCLPWSNMDGRAARQIIYQPGLACMWENERLCYLHGLLEHSLE